MSLMSHHKEKRRKREMREAFQLLDAIAAQNAAEDAAKAEAAVLEPPKPVIPEGATPAPVIVESKTRSYNRRSTADLKVVRFRPQGAVLEIFKSKDPEIGLSGPAGTGKSRGIIEKIHLMCLKYKGLRVLMCRKTRTSMTESCMLTYEKFVQSPLDSVHWSPTKQSYTYPNESAIIVCGLDEPTRIMSTEYEVVYLQEAIEATERDFDYLITRIGRVAGVSPYQQLLFDTNPGPASHWLYQRFLRGKVKMLESTLKDNASFYNEETGQWTEQGLSYRDRLERNLTGVRYDRLVKGIWRNAEGAVYDEYNAAVHVIDDFIPPLSWPRVWAIDFGYVNPFAFLAFAMDSDRRMYLYKQLYHTHLTVSDAAKIIRENMRGDVWPAAIVCDHDAEDRATLEQQWGRPTVPAYKAIHAGIKAVKERLRIQSDKKPRLMICRNSLFEPDQILVNDHKPYRLQDEIESYTWNSKPRAVNVKDVLPFDRDNHALDALRYAVAHVDGIAIDPQEVSIIHTLPDDARVNISPY